MQGVPAVLCCAVLCMCPHCLCSELPVLVLLLLSQVSEGDFIKTMRLAALATQPLIQAQLQLAGAAAGEDSRSAAVPGELQHPLQHLQQQQNSLGLLYPSQQLQQAVDELMRQPLQELFSQQPQQSAARGDKALRARQLAQLQRQLLRDLKRRGLVADEHTQAAAAAAAGLYSREDVLRSFDLLQSRVMRELLLQVGRQLQPSVVSARYRKWKYLEVCSSAAVYRHLVGWLVPPYCIYSIDKSQLQASRSVLF